jgi:N-acetyl sugar amidotransferase
MISYCTRCVLPSTKPYISFDEEGVCGACRAHEQKRDVLGGIDWAARAAEFDTLLDDVKAQRAPFFDVLVPVSGGKDSISQVARVLDHGLRILAVNVDYGIKTEVGRRNLERIPPMGATLLVHRPEEPLQKRLIRLGLEDFGDPDLMSHTLLHAFPQHVARQFDVPLVLLGENSAFEYGGDSEIAAAPGMTAAWFEKFAANAGRDARFVSTTYGIPYEQLRLYDLPIELPRSVWTSWFFNWDSEENLEIAKRHGFESLHEPGEGTYRTYVGIDEKINRVHQYLKVLKFGYGRATDHACEDIRNGRLSREEAKELVRRYDLEPLSRGLAQELADYLELDLDAFDATLERYRNLDLWERDTRGAWTIPGHLEDRPVSLGT